MVTRMEETKKPEKEKWTTPELTELCGVPSTIVIAGSEAPRCRLATKHKGPHIMTAER